MFRVLKYLSLLIFSVFFLTHCDGFPFQKRDGNQDQGDCDTRGDRCGPKVDNQAQDNGDYDDEDTSSDSLFYLLNKTDETVSVSYNRGSESLKTSIQDNQCMAFHTNDLRYIELTPSRCSWDCSKDDLGCRYCPTDSGYYVMDLERFPDDVHPSMYSGFRKTDQQDGHSSCFKFR